MQEVVLNIEAKGTEPEPKYKDWEIEDAARTIMRAEEIKQDKELMALVGPKIQKQAKAAINAAQVLYNETEKKGDKDEN